MNVHRELRLGVVAALAAVAPLSWALGPHEVLVLANRESPVSLEIARQYARLRQVPDANVVPLDLPWKEGSVPVEIAPADFTKEIWEPANKALEDRGIKDHVLAWLYAPGFPVRISGTPPLSITGLTFLRNRRPDSEVIAKGTYASPLFAGPDNPGAAGFPAQSLDVQKAWLGKDMPLPAMMLGFIGPRGNTREEVLACMERGLRADGTRPEGTVYFVTNTDVRSLCRQWEILSSARELNAAGVKTVVTNALPEEANGIAGAMMGAADLDLKTPRKFLPGAMAEHLTSFGAAFESGGQTKITEWIRAGATASAGTVTEPLALWTKFPHARFHAHSAAGCTILESFYQSIRCPLQILPLGEPLAAPWRQPAQVTLRGLESGRVEGRVDVTASVAARPGETYGRFLFLVDGRVTQALGRKSVVTIEAASLRNGGHVLRAVAYAAGTLRSQAFAEASFNVGPTP